MSTLNVTYSPLSTTLSSCGGGPESVRVRRLTAGALERLAYQSNAQAALNDLYTLQEEARTGVSGIQMSAETLEICKRFLLMWPKALPVPELALDNDGEVLFDWGHLPKGMVSLSLRSDGRISYAGQLGAKRTMHGTETFDEAVPPTVLEAIKSLYSN